MKLNKLFSLPTLAIFLFSLNSNGQNFNYTNLRLKVKKTTIICDKDKMEPPFDITIYLDSNIIKFEIYGYGNASKYNFRLDSCIKQFTVFKNETKIYKATLQDVDKEDELYKTEIAISFEESKYNIRLKLPNSENCNSNFEAVIKKNKTNAKIK